MVDRIPPTRSLFLTYGELKDMGFADRFIEDYRTIINTITTGLELTNEFVIFTEERLLGLDTSIIPVFEEAGAYPRGLVVLYLVDNRYYKALEAIAPGPFDPAQWQQLSINQNQIETVLLEDRAFGVTDIAANVPDFDVGVAYVKGDSVQEGNFYYFAVHDNGPGVFDTTDWLKESITTNTTLNLLNTNGILGTDEYPFPFDVGTAYLVGDLVSHIQGPPAFRFYVAEVDNGPGAFDPNNWSEISMSQIYDYLILPPNGLLFRDALVNYVIGIAAEQEVVFNLDGFFSDVIIDNTTGRITVALPGVYTVSAQLLIDASANNTTVFGELAINGVTVAASRAGAFVKAAGDQLGMTITAPVLLGDGDYISAFLSHDSAASRTIGLFSGNISVKR